MENVETEKKKVLMVDKTLDTCTHNDTTYPVGHIVYEGCKAKCECMRNGQMACMERCSIPLFPMGSFEHDDLCYEEPMDECCVMVACARGSSGARGNNNNIKLITLSSLLAF